MSNDQSTSANVYKAAGSEQSAKYAKKNNPAAIIAGATRQGGKSVNQDRPYYWVSDSEDIVMAAGFDGHGVEGTTAAENCVRETATFVEQNKAIFSRWTPAMWKHVLQMHIDHLHTSFRELLVNRGVIIGGVHVPCYADANGVVRTTQTTHTTSAGDPVHGGTTASIVVYAQNVHGERFIVCANVGDSDVITIRNGTASVAAVSAVAAVAAESTQLSDWHEMISAEHDPSNQDEWTRIYQTDSAKYQKKLRFVYELKKGVPSSNYPNIYDEMGTRVAKYVSNPWGNGLQPSNVRYEPAMRVITNPTDPELWRDSTSLAMTRTIGDFYSHQFGVTHEPSIRVKMLKSAKAPAQTDQSAQTDMSAQSDMLVDSVDSVDTDPEFVVLASDGVWDCQKYAEFAQMVYIAASKVPSDSTLQTLADSLNDDNYAKGVGLFGARGVDDSTLVIFRIPQIAKKLGAVAA